MSVFFLAAHAIEFLATHGYVCREAANKFTRRCNSATDCIEKCLYQSRLFQSLVFQVSELEGIPRVGDEAL